VDAVLSHGDQAGTGVAADGLGESGAALGERGRLQVEVDEDEAEEGLDVDRVQAEAGLVQAGDAAGLGGADEPSVQLVRPAVVRAADRLPRRLGVGDQAGAAVPADVEVGGEAAVLGAYDQDLAARGGGGEARSGSGEVGLVADQLPGPGEDVLGLGLGEGRIGVVAGGERLPGVLGGLLPPPENGRRFTVAVP
jgi:hypothetical protein